eukprot:gene9938-12186_t
MSRPIQSAYNAGLRIFGFRPEGSPNLGLKYLRKALIGDYLLDYYPRPFISNELIGNSNEKGETRSEQREREIQRGKAPTKKGQGKQALKRKK